MFPCASQEQEQYSAVLLAQWCVCVLMIYRKKKQDEDEAEQKRKATENAFQGAFRGFTKMKSVFK